MEKNINISNRLKVCGEMVTIGSKIIDVGTDHAYLPIYLLLKNKIKSAIACDVRKGPLENAKSNIKKFNLEEKIETRLSDGLLNINENEAEEIIIAGMGGLLISEILEKCPFENKLGKKFVLQPMNHEKDLRIYLAKKGYKIEKEKAITCSGKIYIVLKAVYDSKPYLIKETEKYIGNLNPKDKDSLLYIEKQLRDINNRKTGAKIKNEKEKENYYLKVISQINEYIKENSNG